MSCKNAITRAIRNLYHFDFKPAFGVGNGCLSIQGLFTRGWEYCLEWISCWMHVDKDFIKDNTEYAKDKTVLKQMRRSLNLFHVSSFPCHAYIICLLYKRKYTPLEPDVIRHLNTTTFKNFSWVHLFSRHGKPRTNNSLEAYWRVFKHLFPSLPLPLIEFFDALSVIFTYLSKDAN